MSHDTRKPRVPTYDLPTLPSQPVPTGLVGTWATLRKDYLRDAVSEFTGTLLLVLFGSASGCQVVLSSSTEIAASPKGSYLSVAFGYAVGISIGVWVASGSGGHINPAVTLAFAYFRGFPWKKVPMYIISQVLGGLFGTLICWGNYMHAIHIVDPGKTRVTASFFAIYAQDYLPSAACFFSEFLGAALLIMTIFAALDKNNGAPPPGLVPLILFILFIGLGACLGMNTAFGVNPARDFGPRLGLAMLGYSHKVIWSYRSQFWIWSGIIAPICGTLCGGAFYDAFLYTGNDSIFTNTYLNGSARDEPPIAGGSGDAV